MKGDINMKEFIDKLISRLEEVAIETLGINKSQFAMDKGEYSSYCSLSLCEVREKANQLAEEYKSSISITDYDLIIKFIESEIERTSSFAEHDTQINIMNYVQQLQEQNNNGWIPCSSGVLPVGKEYEIYDEEEDITYHKHVWVKTDNVNILYCVAFYDTDCWFDAVTNVPISVVAWQNIAPYQPKGE